MKGNKKKVDHVEKEEMENNDLGFDDPFFTQTVSVSIISMNNFFYNLNFEFVLNAFITNVTINCGYLI